jgi:hypothetical protein
MTLCGSCQEREATELFSDILPMCDGCIRIIRSIFRIVDKKGYYAPQEDPDYNGKLTGYWVKNEEVDL